MVRKNSTSQYSSRIGQKTGTSNAEKNVAAKPKSIAFADEYLHAQRAGFSGQGKLDAATACKKCHNQRAVLCCCRRAHQNLNSGSRLTKGLNSSLPFCGSMGPSRAGSTCRVDQHYVPKPCCMMAQQCSYRADYARPEWHIPSDTLLPADMHEHLRR